MAVFGQPKLGWAEIIRPFFLCASAENISRKNLRGKAKYSIFNNMSSYNMADTGGQRNEEPLTAEQKRQVEDYAVSLGMPIERIRHSDIMLTCYAGGGIDLLVIGTDVLPLGERSKLPNDNISPKGVIAHELVGHCEILDVPTPKGDGLIICTPYDGDFMKAQAVTVSAKNGDSVRVTQFRITHTRPCFNNRPISPIIKFDENVDDRFLQVGNKIELELGIRERKPSAMAAMV